MFDWRLKNIRISQKLKNKPITSTGAVDTPLEVEKHVDPQDEMNAKVSESNKELLLR